MSFKEFQFQGITCNCCKISKVEISSALLFRIDWLLFANVSLTITVIYYFYLTTEKLVMRVDLVSFTR